MNDDVLGLLAYIYRNETGYGATGARVNLANTGAGTIRNRPIKTGLSRQITQAVTEVYGPDYRVSVYSGGQPAKGQAGQRVGSTRHDDGRAADVYIYGPDGKQVTGDALGSLAQYWLAKGFGGVGLEMRGGGIHLDEHIDRGRTWNYAAEGGSYTPAQRAAVDAGLRGVLPKLSGASVGIDPRAYDVVYGGIPAALRPAKPITQMTVGEVMDWQDSLKGKVDSTAVGAVQIIGSTLRGQVSRGVVDRDDPFNAETQDKLAISLMRGRGLDDWRAGRISTEKFGTNLAMEWASLPVLQDTYRGSKFVPRGHGYYGGVATNPSQITRTSVNEFASVLGDPGQIVVSTMGGGGGANPSSPAGGTYASGAARRYARQAMPVGQPDPSRHMQPWVAPQTSLIASGYGDNSSYLPREVYHAVGPADAPDYNTPGGANTGAGPMVHPGWAKAFADEWTDDWLVRSVKDQIAAGRYDWDAEFNPVELAVQDGYGQQVEYLGRARNREHYDYLVTQIEAEHMRQRRRQTWEGTGAEFLGAMLAPTGAISMFIPGSIGIAALRTGGANALRVGASAAALTAGYEGFVERGRQGLDPNADPLDSLMRVGGATVFAGLLGGALGAIGTNAARRNFGRDFVDDLASSGGVGKITRQVEVHGRSRVVTTDPAKVTPDVAPLVRQRGVAIIGDEVIVDDATILRRVKERDVPAGVNTPNELMEYEIARATSLAGKADATVRRFMADEGGALRMPGGKRADEVPPLKAGINGVEVDRARIDQAFAKGSKIALGPAEGTPAAKRIKPIQIDTRLLDSPEEAEKMVREAAALADKAVDNAEFRDGIGRMFEARARAKVDGASPEDRAAAAQAERLAEEDAEKGLERWRKENNKILQEKRTAALSRLMDGPFKRVHRNALSGELRDLVDILASDGSFARLSDELGLSIGPSVYSRAKTWDGVVRRLWDAEREIYGRYLGFPNDPTVADVSLTALRNKRADGSQAMKIEEFRARATKALITGKRDKINEINEMVEHLRGAFKEYEDVSARYGVISTQENLKARADRLKERADMLRERAGRRKKESVNRANKAETMEETAAMSGPSPEEAEQILADAKLKWQAAVDADNRSLAEEAEARMLEAEGVLIDDALKKAKREPGEDYFTRLWSQRAIRANRDAFRERVVKPWMMQQPYVDVWEEGFEELGERIAAIKAAGDDINAERFQKLRTAYAEAVRRNQKFGQFKRIKTSSDMGDINKRAEQMIDTILREAEPDDLSTMREPSRPAFGRHRQFNIPNRLLLKDGPEGNGIEDFIETDYLLIHKIYAERMGPAIEMARSFARPADGVDWQRGFDEAVKRARDAEEAKFSGDGFNDHWAPIERDLMHLKDRVLNRVMRDPERWDNRAATALRNWSHLAFMGMSALPAIQEVGKIIMEHGVTKTWRSAVHTLDSTMAEAMQAGIVEGRKAGAILDVALGSSLSRFAETGWDATTGTAPERWLRTAANRYFLWNGLAPMTTRLKEMDLSLRVSDTTERINRVGTNTGDDLDLRELARYGISRKDAEAMASEPIYSTRDGHWFANTDAWGDEELVRKFRAAIRQGNENTVLAATAADKPTIVDGTIYFRKGGKLDKYALRAGLEDHGDYWRVQSGMMSLPFTFWNYAIAAQNKILLAAVDEPSAQRLGGIAAMVGLGYMVTQLRSDEGQWARMRLEDRVAAALDQSGILGVIPNYAHVGQSLSIGAGMGNPLPIQPRHGYHPSAADAAFTVAGAGPSVARNLVHGAMSGDMNEMSWGLPYRNWIGAKWLFDAAIDGLEQRGAGG